MCANGGVRRGDKGSISSQEDKLGKQVSQFSLINPATQDVFLTFHVCRPSCFPALEDLKDPIICQPQNFCCLHLSVHSIKIVFAREKLSLLNGLHMELATGMGAVWVVLNLSFLWPYSHPFASRSTFPGVLSHVAVEILGKGARTAFCPFLSQNKVCLLTSQSLVHSFFSSCSFISRKSCLFRIPFILSGVCICSQSVLKLVYGVKHICLI